MSCGSPALPRLSLHSDAEEAATGADNLHPLAARHPGGSVRQNPVPGHLHAGGGRIENQPAGVPSPGEN